MTNDPQISFVLERPLNVERDLHHARQGCSPVSYYGDRESSLAKLAELDGDEIGYLVAKVAEIKRQG